LDCTQAHSAKPTRIACNPLWATFSIGGVLQASYKYDFAGRQVVRTVTTPTAVTVHSIFDSNGNRIAEHNEATGALIREYVWLDGAPLAVIEGGVVNFIRTDYIGRPVFATNAAGTKTWTASYLPFGQVRTTTGTPIALRFPGQWFQSESGLHQNWMRDYDPTTGRYLQADPLGLIDGPSVYGYAKGNPGRWVDTRGEQERPFSSPTNLPFDYDSRVRIYVTQTFRIITFLRHSTHTFGTKGIPAFLR
jgi:RHS repeat-associated protein